MLEEAPWEWGQDPVWRYEGDKCVLCNVGGCLGFISEALTGIKSCNAGAGESQECITGRISERFHEVLICVGDAAGWGEGSGGEAEWVWPLLLLYLSLTRAFPKTFPSLYPTLSLLCPLGFPPAPVGRGCTAPARRAQPGPVTAWAFPLVGAMLPWRQGVLWGTQLPLLCFLALCCAAEAPVCLPPAQSQGDFSPFS